MFNLDEYTTVAERIKLFRDGHPMGRILTQLIYEDATRVVFRAELYRDDVDERPFSTGYSREITSERGVNRDFALENGETSAIGIACKNAGIGTDKNSISREEAAKVIRVNQTKTVIDETKAKMTQTSKEYIPVPVEDDPWSIKTVEPPKTSAEAVDLVKDIIGGQTEKDIPNCSHGKPRILRTGTGKNGKQWAAWDCAFKSAGYQVGQEKPCDPERIWLELSPSGTWVPQKGR